MSRSIGARRGAAAPVARLDLNENPRDLPAGLKRSILRKAMSLPFNRYYSEPGGPSGKGIEDLQAVIAGINGVRPDMVTLGNGSDELVMLNVLAAAGPRGRVVTWTPTFGVYAMAARAVGSALVEVPLDSRFEPDAARMAAAADGPDCLVFICRPNSPTGNICDARSVEYVLDHTAATVVVDEAYHEFCGETVLPLMRKYPRLCVMRTLSKAFGLAGLRLGYMLASPECTARVRSLKMPFNINVFTQMAAIEVLKRRETVTRAARRIARERARLEERLSEIPGLTVFPSVTNFVLVRVPLDSGEAHRALREKGVYVRHLENMPGYLRIAAGSRAENNRLVQALNALLGRDAD
ncbi:MAG: histidinol-phosphate aminotransferase family protein [Firmicutes bacterium]|nr:histidinol-phosphate aminotransferase family protein [Bacillota bacterium]